jgi:hypothetical protein
MAQIQQPMIDVKVHRRVLRFLNAARSPEDLMMAPPNEIPLFDPRVMYGMDEVLHLDEHPPAHDHAVPPKGVEPIMDRHLAKRVLEARDDHSPLYGFMHISQLQKISGFDRASLERLIWIFSPRFRGKWEVLYADAD